MKSTYTTLSELMPHVEDNGECLICTGHASRIHAEAVWAGDWSLCAGLTGRAT